MRGSTDTGRGLIVLVVAALIAIASALPAVADQGPEPAGGRSASGLGLSAAIGFGRGPSEAAWTLVEVTAAPDRPLAGEVGARTVLGADVTTARRLEVAAGATKVVSLLLPPAAEVEVWFEADDGERVGIPDGRGAGGVLVGGIGGAPALPDPLSSAGTDRPVRGVRVDRDVLDLGPRALDALDALVVTGEELRALSPERREALTVAVATGLDLLVPRTVGAAALPLPWDPAEAVDGGGGRPTLAPDAGAWALTSADLGADDGRTVAAAVPAGRGRVVALASAPGQASDLDRPERLWATVLQPRASLAPPLRGHGGDPRTSLFGHGAGLPGVRGAALFLVAFLVVVGPGNALLLRRLGRRELAWVTVPAITLLFTGVAAVTAVAGAPTTSPVVRAAWWQDGVGEELTAVALQAPDRGVHTVAFPGRRDARLLDDWGEAAGSTTREEERTALSVHLEPLQVTTVVGVGPATAPAPLEVRARVEDGELTVEVANVSEARLEDVRVHLATQETDLGSLGPGETTRTEEELDETLPPPRGVAGPGRGPALLHGRPEPAQQATPGPEAARELLRWSLLDRSPGTVWVTAATTDDLGLLAPSVPGRMDDRGSFVAVGAGPDHGGGDVRPHQVRRDLLLDASRGAWRPEPLLVDAPDELVLRFRLPAGSPRGAVVSSLDAGGPLGQQGMQGPGDPFGEGCFEVVEVDPDGERGEPEERCGHAIACPPDARECSGSDRQVEACFADGSCRISLRLPGGRGAPGSAGGVPDGLEVYDHRAGAWRPAQDAFVDGRAELDRVASPLGEVLVRALQVDHLDVGRRGIGLTVEDTT